MTDNDNKKIKSKKKNCTIHLEIFDEEKAKEWLNRGNAPKRTTNKTRVKTYADMMKNDQWHSEAFDPIYILNADDSMLNGVHRLKAVVESKSKDIEFLIIHVDDKEVVHRIDVGQIRTPAESIQLDGGYDKPTAKTMAHMIKIMALAAGFPNQKTIPNIDYVTTFRKFHSELKAGANKGFVVNNSKYNVLVRFVKAFELMLTWLHKDQKKINRFLSAIYDPDNIDVNDIALVELRGVLRKYLDEQQTISDGKVTYDLIDYWNMFNNEESKQYSDPNDARRVSRPVLKGWDKETLLH